jgi:hypothetical protein
LVLFFSPAAVATLEQTTIDAEQLGVFVDFAGGKQMFLIILVFKRAWRAFISSPQFFSTYKFESTIYLSKNVLTFSTFFTFLPFYLFLILLFFGNFLCICILTGKLVQIVVPLLRHFCSFSMLAFYYFSLPQLALTVWTMDWP